MGSAAGKPQRQRRLEIKVNGATECNNKRTCKANIEDENKNTNKVSTQSTGLFSKSDTPGCFGIPFKKRVSLSRKSKPSNVPENAIVSDNDFYEENIVNSRTKMICDYGYLDHRTGIFFPPIDKTDQCLYPKKKKWRDIQPGNLKRSNLTSLAPGNDTKLPLIDSSKSLRGSLVSLPLEVLDTSRCNNLTEFRPKSTPYFSKQQIDSEGGTVQKKKVCHIDKTTNASCERVSGILHLEEKAIKKDRADFICDDNDAGSILKGNTNSVDTCRVSSPEYDNLDLVESVEYNINPPTHITKSIEEDDSKLVPQNVSFCLDHKKESCLERSTNVAPEAIRQHDSYNTENHAEFNVETRVTKEKNNERTQTPTPHSGCPPKTNVSHLSLHKRTSANGSKSLTSCEPIVVPNCTLAMKSIKESETDHAACDIQDADTKCPAISSSNSKQKAPESVPLESRGLEESSRPPARLAPISFPDRLLSKVKKVRKSKLDSTSSSATELYVGDSDKLATMTDSSAFEQNQHDRGDGTFNELQEARVNSNKIDVQPCNNTITKHEQENLCQDNRKVKAIVTDQDTIDGGNNENSDESDTGKHARVMSARVLCNRQIVEDEQTAAAAGEFAHTERRVMSAGSRRKIDDPPEPLRPLTRIEIKNQTFEEGLRPEFRDGGVSFFIPVSEDGLRPHCSAEVVQERITKSRKSQLRYEEKMMMAQINRQVQLSKRKQFAVKEVQKIKSLRERGSSDSSRAESRTESASESRTESRMDNRQDFRRGAPSQSDLERELEEKKYIGL